MKKVFVSVFLIVLAVMATPSLSIAATGSLPVEAPVSKHLTSEEINSRLEQLRSLDKKSMSAEQKRTLRRELRELKKQNQASGGGVYLSVGAVILIIVLLIIFL